MANDTIDFGPEPTVRGPAAGAFPGSGSLVAAPFIFMIHNPAVIFYLLLTLYATKLFYNVLLHPLAKVPGPLLAKLSFVWITKQQFGGLWNHKIVELHKQYGPVVRVGPNQVLFVDKAALKRVYGFSSGETKSPWYQSFQVPELPPAMFATQDEELHKFLRTRVASTYAMSAILPLESNIQTLIDGLFSKFGDFAKQGKKFDLFRYNVLMAFDVITEIATGGALGFVREEKDHFGLIAAISGAFYVQSNSGYMPGQTWWITNGFSRFLNARFGTSDTQGMDKFVAFLALRIQERMANPSTAERRDVFQHFIDMKQKNGEPARVEDVIGEAGLLLAAGAESVAFAISAIQSELIKHPHVFQKLRAEVDEAYGKLKLQDGEGFPYLEAMKLPYLVAVCKEAMRINSSGQFEMPRMAPEQGLDINGIYVPKGTHVATCSHTANHDKAVFGEDADMFKPERWIATSPEQEATISEQNSLLMTDVLKMAKKKSSPPSKSLVWGVAIVLAGM